jgi:hypothetical protein
MDPSIERLWFFFFPIHKNSYRSAFSTSSSTDYESPSYHKKLHDQEKCTNWCDGVSNQKTADGWHLGREITCSLNLTAAALCVASREGIKSAPFLILCYIVLPFHFPVHFLHKYLLLAEKKNFIKLSSLPKETHYWYEALSQA